MNSQPYAMGVIHINAKAVSLLTQLLLCRLFLTLPLEKMQKVALF